MPSSVFCTTHEYLRGLCRFPWTTPRESPGTGPCWKISCYRPCSPQALSSAAFITPSYAAPCPFIASGSPSNGSNRPSMFPV
jgi:hypothetical protein